MKANLDPATYSVASKMQGGLIRSVTEYTMALETSKRAGGRSVEVPVYLTEDMRNAIQAESDPVLMWRAALSAAGAL